MQEFWNWVPGELASSLLVGSVGKLQLLSLADRALALTSHRSAVDASRLLSLGLDILLTAWAADPLDGSTAGHLLTLDGSLRRLPPGLRAAATFAHRSWRQPANLSYYQRLMQRRETGRMWKYLETERLKDPGNLFWLQQALAHNITEDEKAELPWLNSAELPGGPALWGSVLAQQAFHKSEYERALTFLDQGDAARGAPLALDLRGECLARLGRRDQALANWKKCLLIHPWRVNLFLRLHDLLERVDQALAPPGDDAAVLLYTYNKAREIDRTLESLFSSELGGARVLVLNNGGQDDTAEVFARWTERRPELECVHLPVNVGAPAARNWLMRHESVSRCRFLAYLDDDALVPPDWLGLLGAAARRYPDAGVWGCRVADAVQPAVLQSVDMGLIDPEADPDETNRRHFRVSDLHVQTLDEGCFTYLRPCATVTGCCHMFERERLLSMGGFDLQFSPTQYDDVDLDLRLIAAGAPAVYQGHLRVEHLKRSGRLSQRETKAWGNAYANYSKLQMKHDPESVLAMRELVREIQERDLRNKIGVSASFFSTE